MVHVKKEWDFEIPKTCASCPMLHCERDGNATLEFCSLKKGHWSKCLVSYKDNYNFSLNTYGEMTRDKDCPLIDGESYEIP